MTKGAVKFLWGRGSERSTGRAQPVLEKERWGEGKWHQPLDEKWMCKLMSEMGTFKKA